MIFPSPFSHSCLEVTTGLLLILPWGWWQLFLRLAFEVATGWLESRFSDTPKWPSIILISQAQLAKVAPIGTLLASDM